MTEVHESHPHLYHYTNFDGLRGILETQTLWATHYTGLNDSSEILLLRPRLEDLIFEKIREIIREDMKRGYSRRKFWEKHGGITRVSREEAKKLTNVFYEATFLGTSDTVPIATPYILSFCAHTGHNDYTKNNGLLSQWRAYGENGGYALVFDTKRLWECLNVEWKYYNYVGGNFGDVVYDDETGKFEIEFTNLFSSLGIWVRSFASKDKEPPSEDVLAPLLSAASRFKHRGFKEESEVRVSVYPTSEAFARTVKEEVPLKLKPIQYRKKGDDQVQYIALNEVPKKKPLPIIRIIIGPQRDQKQRAKDVKKIIGKKNIDIVCSETPYLPPQARISN